MTLFSPRTGMSTDGNLKRGIKENKCESIKAQWGNIRMTVYNYTEIIITK